MRVAVVDDNKIFLTMYSKMIKEAFSNHNVSVDIKTFDKGTKFIKEFESSNFELVFMDIDMPELSGIDAASELRRIGKEFDIIFVSAHPHFVFETIKFIPFRFIRKTNLKKETFEAVDSYCNRSQLKFKMISLELINGDRISEKVVDIAMFFSVRHDIFYTIRNEIVAKVLSRKYNLSQIERFTNEYGFIRVHKSYIVNFRFIKTINAKSILMADKKEIPISHGTKTEVQEKLMKFLRNEELL